MARKDKEKSPDKPAEQTATGAPAGDAAVKVDAWTQTSEPKNRRFPYPGATGVAMRMTVTREGFADLVQHAKESLRAEICGVLVGNICKDDDGLWVEVTATIRGNAATQGATHVTFTQETWTRIHEEKERLHKSAAIVGWYHSHPGFGVEFSDMDTFIHRNFFSGPAQIAFLTDPVGGEDAACINDGSGVRCLDRCWVDGRERRLKVPAAQAGAATVGAAGAGALGGASQARIEQLEARVSQLISVIDDFRNRVWSFYLTVGMVVVLVAVAWLGWNLFGMWAHRMEPPEYINSVSMPVRIGDKDVILEAQVTGWHVPPELNSLLLQEIELDKKEAEAKAAASAAAAAAEAAAATTPAPAVP